MDDLKKLFELLMNSLTSIGVALATLAVTKIGAYLGALPDWATPIINTLLCGLCRG